MAIVSLSKLSKLRRRFEKTVLAGGVFDILHPGHIAHLIKAKSLGKTLIVHITGDKRVREKKGVGRPITPEKYRALIISSLRFVDFVFIYNGKHYDQKIIDTLRPDILFFNKKAFTPEVKLLVNNLKNFSGKIFVDKQEKIFSASKIIKRLKKLKLPKVLGSEPFL